MGSAFRHGSHRCGQQTRTRGPRGPEVGDLDAVHWIWPMASLVFFVVSWSFPGICLVSFLYVFGVLDFFLYLTGLLYFSKVFWKGNFLVYIMFLVFFWCFYKLWCSSIFQYLDGLFLVLFWQCFLYFSCMFLVFFLVCSGLWVVFFWYRFCMF